MYKKWKTSYQSIIILFTLFILWELVVWILNIPSYRIPSPSDITIRSYQEISLLINHTKILFIEVFFGYIIGVSFGIILASIISLSSFFKPILSLLVIASQSIPKVAIAPLVILWIGFGIIPKIFFSAFVCILPMVISVTRGLTTIDQDLLDLSKTWKMSKFQLFWKIRLPNSIPYIIDGMKISLPLSLIGAVVGEFVLADGGLGYLVELSSSNFDTPLAFSALFFMSLLGLSMYSVVCFLEKIIKSKIGGW